MAKIAREKDPDKVGVNFIISSFADKAAEIDPSTGQSFHPVKVEDYKITIDPPLENATLAGILNAIFKGAKPPDDVKDAPPLKYSIEDYAVVFTAAPVEAPKLYTRTYRVNPNTFLKNIEKMLAATPEKAESDQIPVKIPNRTDITEKEILQENVRTIFANAGLQFNPPVILTNSTDALPPRKAIFFDDRKGVLLVRATLADLSKVESALQSLNSAPPQITIETRVIEDFEEDAARAVELVLRSAEVNTLKAPATNKSIVTVSDLLKDPNLRVVMDESDNRSLAEIRGSFEHASGAGSGILTEPEFRVIIRAYEQRKGIDILMPLRLTTASGHSAHVSDEDPSFVGRRYGITVTPIVETNGMTMYLSAEFDGSGLRNEPDFKVKGTVRLVDGQTLVLWPAVSRNKPRPVVFITPRIVGPAGNRVHTPDFPEMNTIPAQN